MLRTSGALTRLARRPRRQTTRQRLLLCTALALTVLGGALGAIGSRPAAERLAAPAVHAAPGAFLETFDGAPASPQPWRRDNWDLRVHSRDANTWSALEPMAAHHGPDCAPAPATHQQNGLYDDAVFQCRDHVMTSLTASGYGVIYLTPDHMVDFSAGEAVVKWDVSTLRSSSRDWLDLWVSPYDDHLQTPLQDWLPDLNGAPRNALHLRLDGGAGTSAYRGTIYRDGVAEELSTEWWTHYEDVLTPSATRRDTFELRVSRTHVRFGMPQYGLWWLDADVKDLGWDRGVVQLGHHSYNPLKDCPAGATCAPNTWHWDNVSIAPAAPFAMMRADRRAVDQTTAPGVAFPAGAPAGSRLRFAGTGADLEVSFDDGRTWQAAARQPQTKHDPSTFSSYFTPIPAGASRVQFRGRGGWWGGDRWGARDIAVWTPAAPAARAPAATQAPAATATRPPATPVPATQAPATATPVPAAGAPSQAPAQGQFTLRANGLPTTVPPGTTASGSIEIRSTTAVTATISVEVYSPTARVFQRTFERQSFSAGQSLQFPLNWQVPASATPGTYTVKAGVFSADWSTLYQWDERVAQFTVTAPDAPHASPTQAPAAPATPTPATDRNPNRFTRQSARATARAND